jgi:hypothetical protein
MSPFAEFTDKGGHPVAVLGIEVTSIGLFYANNKATEFMAIGTRSENFYVREDYPTCLSRIDAARRTHFGAGVDTAQALG